MKKRRVQVENVIYLPKTLYTVSVHNKRKQIKRGKEDILMKSIQFNELEEQTLNGFWQGVGVGLGAGVVIGGLVVLT